MISADNLSTIKTLSEEVREKASTVGLYYVVCVFKSCITNNLDRRFGLFGDATEAERFYKMLKSVYTTTFPTKFWLDSNVGFLPNEDCGLLSDDNSDDNTFLEDLHREQLETM